MKRLISVLLFFLLLYPMQTINCQTNKKGAMVDPSRLYRVMTKAKNGDSIIIGALGGSITKGYAASSDSTKWANLVQQWWQKKFPKATIKLINAGIGGAGSNIGAFRVKDDLLKYNPDLIIIEFGVNDSLNYATTEYMEGLVRQILDYPNHPAAMMLILKDEKGMTAQKYQKPIGEYYKIPIVSFADQIDKKVAKDKIKLQDIFIDGLHPLDNGMKYIAGMITDEMEEIYKDLPSPKKLPVIDTILPAPLVTDEFQYTTKYSNKDLIPLSNKGWKEDESGWCADTPGAEITFALKGSTLAVLFTKHNDKLRGKAELWVDNKEHIILDAYWTETWGPALRYKTIGKDLNDKEHILHIKTMENDETGGSYFQVLNVLKTR